MYSSTNKKNTNQYKNKQTNKQTKKKKRKQVTETRLLQVSNFILKIFKSRNYSVTQDKQGAKAF